MLSWVWPPELTGFVAAVGPAVIVIVSVPAGLTWTWRLRVWADADPCGSLTVTDSVYVCVVPVVFVGAVQSGLAIVELLNVPAGPLQL